MKEMDCKYCGTVNSIVDDDEALFIACAECGTFLDPNMGPCEAAINCVSYHSCSATTYSREN